MILLSFIYVLTMKIVECNIYIILTLSIYIYIYIVVNTVYLLFNRINYYLFYNDDDYQLSINLFVLFVRGCKTPIYIIIYIL